MKRLIIYCILFIFLVIPSKIYAVENSGTEILGIISKDTTWDESGSPYIIKGNVLVDSGVKLVINEGVEVKFDGAYYIKVKGNLISKGSHDNQVKFQSNADNIKWAGIELNSRDNIIDYSSISNSSRGIVSNGGNVISNSDISNIQNDYSAYGIYSSGDDKIINTHVNNVNSNGYSDQEGIALMGNGGVVDNCLVENTPVGILSINGNKIINSVVRNASSYGIYVISNTIIKNNTIDNAYIGVETSYGGSVISNNTITNSQIGFGMVPYYNNYNINNQVHFNNFIDNNINIKSVPLDFSLDFTNNYFGTTDEVEIKNKIYDYYDDFNYAKILYNPYLTEPVPLDKTAPSIPTVNEITDKSTSITGTAEVGSTITVKTGNSVLGTAVAKGDGTYSVTIVLQNAGTKLTVISTDDAGNVSEATEVIVKDTEKPTINGAIDSIVKVEEAFDELKGVTASDNIDGDITSDIKVTGTVDNTKPNVYTLTYTAIDKSGNVTTVTRKITVIDNVKPVISGATDKSINIGSTFDFKTGVTASDNIDGYLTNTINITGTVDTKKKGVYTLTYTVSDVSGNVTAVTRTITVIDNIKPVIMGATNKTININSTFNPITAITAKDNVNGDLTKLIKITGAVDTKKKGVYTLTYTVSDKSGNKAVITRKITVKDNIKPVISGATAKTIKLKSTFNPKTGVTAKDNVDGNLTRIIKITGTVNTKKKGTYTLTYTVTDKSGNKAVVKRKITVK